jgi:HD-like signal output (HDOD) protein
MIALRHRLPVFEDAFLAGLLHDIGIILEDQHMHASFSQVMAGLQPGTTLAESEFAHLGFDHTTLGELIAERWRFPTSVQAAIRFHHGSVGYRGEHVAIVRCVEVANIICTSKGMSSVGINLLRSNRAAFDALNLNKQDVEVLITDLDHELTLYSHLFTM